MLHKHNPIAEKAMDYTSPNHSICQVLRDIYHKTDDSAIKLKCRVAVTMAKKMSLKLTENKKNWEAGFWDKQQFGEIIQISDKTKVQVTLG